MAAFINEMGRMGKIVSRRALGQTDAEIEEMATNFSRDDVLRIVRLLANQHMVLVGLKASYEDTIEILKESMKATYIQAENAFDEMAGGPELASFMRMASDEFESYAEKFADKLPNEAELQADGLDALQISQIYWALGWPKDDPYYDYIPSKIPTIGRMGLGPIPVWIVLILMGACIYAGYNVGEYVGKAKASELISKQAQRLQELECSAIKMEAINSKLRNGLKSAAETTTDPETKAELERLAKYAEDLQTEINNSRKIIKEAKTDLDTFDRINIGFKNIECIVGKVGYYAVLGGAGILAFKVGSAVLDMIRKK